MPLTPFAGERKCLPVQSTGTKASDSLPYYWAMFRLSMRRQDDSRALGDSVNFVIPTGNFGNSLAGFYAREMVRETRLRTAQYAAVSPAPSPSTDKPTSVYLLPCH